MNRLKGSFSLPLSMTGEADCRTVWLATATASYATLDLHGDARALAPEEIMHGGVTITHIRPLSARWSMMASLGGGVYAEPNHIRWCNILANGGLFAIYRLRDRLSVGFGVGLTNAYGVPIPLPMGYLQWKRQGRYEVDINMAGTPKVKIARQLREGWKLELTAIEIEGITAVVHIDNHERLYSSTMMQSGAAVTYRVRPRMTFVAGCNSVWRRTSRITSRSLKSFWDSTFGGDHSGRYHYDPAVRFIFGFRYGL